MVAELVTERNDTTPDVGRVGSAHQELWLVADELEIDRSYQREPRPAWVKAIADNFDPSLLDPLSVSRRRDGRLFVMDGQHRLLAVRSIGWGDQKVPCIVHNGLTIEEEARRFNTQDNRKPLNIQEKFRARLLERDPVSVRIQAIVGEAGFRLNLTGGDTTNGEIPGVGTLLRIVHAYGPEILRDTLEVIRDGLGTSIGPRSEIVDGIAQFIWRYPTDYDRGRLTAVLRTMTQDRLRAEGGDMSRVLGVSKSHGIGRVVLKGYNNRLNPKNRLPDWESVAPPRGKRRQ